MSFVKIWVHAVWATKDREHVFAPEVRGKLFEHIYQNALEKEILMDIVNGHSEHLHCLFRLRNDQMITKVMQLIKGESSFWFNKQRFINNKLDWQNDYFAVSVSESQVETVHNYIANQEEHHRKKTFSQEYSEFVKSYGFKTLNG